MHSIRNMQVAALLAGASAAFAHEKGGWAFIHWHASDFLGMAVVGVLCVGAFVFARRQKRSVKQRKQQ